MTNWDEKINDVITELSSIQHQLNQLATGFYLTGNDKLGDKLRGIANDLNHSSQVLDSIPNEILTERLRGIEESSKTTFAATLAGIKLATKGRKDV